MIVEHVSRRSGKSSAVTGTNHGKSYGITGTHLLCAVGRVPNTKDVRPEDVGIILTEKGLAEVVEHLRTTCEGVLAGGDCAGRPQSTHIIYDDFSIVHG